MKEYRFVSFNLGSTRFRETRRLLMRCGLTRDADLADEDTPVPGLCDVRLRVDDPRLASLVRELEALGEEVALRADREFTARELDASPWLRLVVKTAGLSGGSNLDQPFDRTRACRTCGAGSSAVPPLRADLARMGKKDIDRTSHDGSLIVSRRLADALIAADFGGFELRPVKGRSRRYENAGYRWLEPVSEWPPMAPTRVLGQDDPCTSCGRSGHYSPGSVAMEFHYSAMPATAADIAYTWEYFGLWQGPPLGNRVGGARELIVSQRMRTLLRDLKVRHVAFEPVVFDHGADA